MSMRGNSNQRYIGSARLGLLATVLLLLARPCPGALTGSGVGNLQWRDFPDVNRSCGQQQGQHSALSDVQSSGVCEPYMTGRWCADGFGLLGSIKCTTTRKDRQKCHRISEGCKYPLKVLATRSDSAVLPVLHAARPGAIDSCLRSRQQARPLHFLFIGDSQTLMLEFEFRRWASGGGVFPRYEEVMGLKEGGVEAAWSSSNVFVAQLIDRCGADSFSSPGNVSARVRSALSAVQPHSHIVVITRYGLRDIARTNCSEALTAELLQGKYEAVTDSVLKALSDTAEVNDTTIDYYMRNLFFSYTQEGKSYASFMASVNPAIERVYAAKKAQYTSLRFRFLDVYSLSEVRQKEMPYFGDGLHWACYSKMPYQHCHHGLLSLTSRPDEVAWAAMQLILLDFCDIYSLL